MITIQIVMITGAISIIYPDITSVLSIMGGLCSVTISYLIPSKNSNVSLLLYSLLLCEDQWEEMVSRI